MKKNINYFFCVVIFFFGGISLLKAQQNFMYHRVGSTEDQFYALTAVENGNFLAVGTTLISGNRRPIITKLNASYDVVWSRIINTTLTCDVYDAIYDPNALGGVQYLVVGTMTNSSSDSDIFVLRFTSIGACNLSRQYSVTDEDGNQLAAARSITAITDNNQQKYIISGFTDRTQNSGGDALSFCIDGSGARLWQKGYDVHTNTSKYIDWANGSLVTPNNELYISTVSSTSEGSSSYYEEGIVKLNVSNGNVLSGCKIVSPESEGAYDVVRLSNGNLVTVTSILPTFVTTGNRDIAMTCVNPNNNYSVVWSRRYSDRFADAAFNIKVGNGDKIYVNGFASDEGNVNPDMVVLAVNGSNGNVIVNETRGFGRSNFNERSGMNSGVINGSTFVGVGSRASSTNTNLRAYLVAENLSTPTRTSCDSVAVNYTASNFGVTVTSAYRACTVTMTDASWTLPDSVTVYRTNLCCTAYTTTITGNTLICPGDVSTLTASGTGLTYLWNTGETTASIDVSPTATYMYIVTATNANGCTSTASITVQVQAAVGASISGPSVICLGSNAILTASGGGSYSWFNGATTSGIVVSPTTSTIYAAVVTGPNGCQEKVSFKVNVSSVTANIAGASSICLGSSTTLTASGGTSYAWSTGATTAAISVAPTTTTIYRVTVTNANGCTGTASRTITVNAVPTGSIAVTSSTICAGASTTLTASGGAAYVWNTGATTSSITVHPNVSTTYSVTVSNDACAAIVSRTITVTQTPISFTTTCYSGSPVNLSVSFPGTNPTYSWVTGSTSNSITVGSTGSWGVTATNDAGCTASTYAVVSQCFVPDGLGTSAEGTLTNPESFDGNSSNLAFTSSNQAILSQGVSLELAPNPTSNEINLNLTLPNLQEVSVSILDLTGRVLQQHQLGQVQSIRQTFSLSDLPSGMYLLIVKGDNGQLALTKIIKE